MKIVGILFCLLLVIQTPLLAQQSTEEQRADSLYQNFKEEQALKAYEQILGSRPDNYEALWRTSFLYSLIGNRQQSKDHKEAYFKKAEHYARLALNVDSTDTQSNFVMSVAMGRMALISSARARVAASRAIKKYVDRAIAYDSTNAGAWHVLGRWNFKVANLNFFERLAAKALFGGIPGNASNEKAIKDIKKAIELRPDYILCHHDLAMVYDKTGQKDKAIKACTNAIGLPSLTPDDPGLKKECQQWIKDWR